MTIALGLAACQPSPPSTLGDPSVGASHRALEGDGPTPEVLVALSFAGPIFDSCTHVSLTWGPESIIPLGSHPGSFTIDWGDGAETPIEQTWPIPEDDWSLGLYCWNLYHSAGRSHGYDVASATPVTITVTNRDDVTGAIVQTLSYAVTIGPSAEPADCYCPAPSDPPPCDATECNDGNPCTDDACDATGCAHTAVADGLPCLDLSSCNGAEACVAGACQTGTPMTCDDANPCTADTCADPGGACAHANVADGTACGNGSTCEEGECAPDAPDPPDEPGATLGGDAAQGGLGSLLAHTQIIVEGTVRALEFCPSGDDPVVVNTYVTLGDLGVWRGAFGDPEITIRLPGGAMDGRLQEMEGTPHFHVGDHAVLLLTDRREALMPIRGGTRGVFRIHTTRTSDLVFTHDGSPVVGLSNEAVVVDYSVMPIEEPEDLVFYRPRRIERRPHAPRQVEPAEPKAPAPPPPMVLAAFRSALLAVAAQHEPSSPSSGVVLPPGTAPPRLAIMPKAQRSSP